MYFEAIAEEALFRDTARAFLESKLPLVRVREIMATDSAVDDDVWAEMADLGWMATAVPEEFGGAGLSALELGLILEEMGRMVTPGPFFSTAVLGVYAFLLGGDDAQKAAYLPRIASGSLRVALAVAERDRGWLIERPGTGAVTSAGGVTITGEKAYVVDGVGADLLLVHAAEGEGGSGVHLVGVHGPGVSVRPENRLDLTRSMATVRLDGAPSVVRLDAPDGTALIEALYDVAATMLAFEQVGGAQRCLDLSVEYAGERIQFGRPIGSFQAVKHKLADMLVAVEAARSAALYAGWALTNRDADLPVAAGLAKSRCSEAFFQAAGDMIQVHGGIGFTWEHDAHLYFKRAKADQMLFGAPSLWRARLATRLDL